MYPALFRVGGVVADTYYVLWFIALSLALLWTVRRFPLYGIDDDEGRRVAGWGFVGMLVGARAFEYIWNFSTYWNNPLLILDLNSGGLSEVGALCGALATPAALCRRNPKISLGRFYDAGCPPVFFALTLGRWGCFFAGCCVGVRSSFPASLHFPYDPPAVTRHPVQIYYSLSAAAILILLLSVEKWSFKRGVPRYSLITPLGFILYSLMRFSIDSLRDLEKSGLLLSHGVLIAGLPFAVAWLAISWRAFRRRT